MNLRQANRDRPYSYIYTLISNVWCTLGEKFYNILPKADGFAWIEMEMPTKVGMTNQRRAD